MDKVYIVSYPRSGNTWMRFLIANIQNPEMDIGYRELDWLVPDAHQEQAWKGKNFDWSPVVFKSHDIIRDDYEKIIYLYRDGRDVALSCYYFYQGGWNNPEWRFKGSFSEYLKRFVVGWNSYGGWKEHVNFWLFTKHYKGKVLFVKYENLLNHPWAILETVLDFAGINYKSKQVFAAIQKSEYSRLKERAPADGQHPYSSGTKGRSGGWKKIFSEEQKKMFWEYAGDVMVKLGYKNEII